MTSTRRWIIAALGLLLFVGLAIGDQLTGRVDELRRQGHYDLALGMLDDQVGRGVSLTPAMAWARAQLTSDPDRFDRLSGELVSGSSPEDSLAQAVVLARAKEQFARGQYLAALENLESLPPSAARRDPDLFLFAGMSASAVGQQRKSKEQFLLVPENSERYAMAQALLAGLSLRMGDARAALRFAETALSVGAADVGPQAMYARAQALQQLGESDRAARTRDELLRTYSGSAEAAWVREGQNVARDDTEPAPGPSVDEIETPKRRLEFALQFGAFHDRGLALRMVGALEGQVDELRIERDANIDPPWYRVVAGRYPSRSAAESARVQLAAAGHDTVVLSPGQAGP